MTKTAVIFDMDGVLVDSEPIYLRSNQRIFASLGIQVPRREYQEFVGTSADRMWSTLKQRFHLRESVAMLAQREYDGFLEELVRLDSLQPIAGVEKLVRGLQALPVRLAVASSSFRKVVTAVLAKSGLAAFFEVLVCGEEVKRGKPDPDIFLKTADHLGVPPAGCLVIEDSPRGIAGAKAAGMRTVGFQNPNSGEHDLSGADVVIDAFSRDNIGQIIRLARVQAWP